MENLLLAGSFLRSARFGLRLSKLDGQKTAASLKRARDGGVGADARQFAPATNKRVAHVRRVKHGRRDGQRTASDAVIRGLLQVLDDGHRRAWCAFAQNALRFVHVEQSRARTVLAHNIDTLLRVFVQVRRQRGELVRTETHAAEPREEVFGVTAVERNQTFGIRGGGVQSTDAHLSPQEWIGTDEQEFVILVRADFFDVILLELNARRKVRHEGDQIRIRHWLIRLGVDSLFNLFNRRKRLLQPLVLRAVEFEAHRAVQAILFTNHGERPEIRQRQSEVLTKS
mmetsp:Transcript_1669/g.6072  ORF Transcript_1669/g.6072 Transcript_1669/m.6072 type:complete len:284 (-) Transcript_1669:539-1390(-)